MIYIKGNQVYYLTAQPVADLFYDLYNFSSMSRIDNAYKDLMDSNFSYLGLQITSAEKNGSYVLELDFLANKKNEYLQTVINQVSDYFSAEGFNPENTEEPLLIRVGNLKIEDIVNFIQDDKFQTVNTIVATTNCTVWKLHKK